MSGARVLLVGDAAMEDRLRVALPELNGNLTRRAATPALAELVATTPDVIAFGPDLTAESVLELAGELDRCHPEIEILMFAEPSPGLWERAARAGVREVVSPSAGDDEVAQAMRELMATVHARRARLGQETADDDTRGAVVVVRSPKGGSGKTMVATNVAVTLAEQHPGQVVLVDLDLQFGDAASALGMEPQYTIADATATADLTPPSLKALLATHPSSLHALCAPPRPDEAGIITGADVTAVLALLKSAFPFVVVDTAAGTDECTTAALAAATDVVLVCSMDVSSVRAIRKDLDASAAAPSAARQHLVLNRANSRVGLEVRDIKDTIGRSVDVTVSSSRIVPLHMNCGRPVVDAEPTSAVAKELREIAARLAPVTASPSGGFWRRRR